MSISRLTLVLMLFSTLNTNELQWDKFCEFLKPNGNYEGIGLFRQYLTANPRVHYMYNRRGAQWRFELSEDRSQIDPLPGAFQTIKKTINKMFGISFAQTDGKTGWTKMKADCFVDEEKMSEVVCKNQLDKTTKVSHPELVGSIIFRGYAGYYTNAYYTVILNRDTKSIHYLRSIAVNPYLEISFINWCYGLLCPDTKFINQMDGTLLSSLDSVVDFDGTYPGFLLLFNIAGRPMICFQNEGKDLSDDCKSTENLKPLFEKCFQDGLTSSTPIQSLSNPIDPLYWVLIIEVVLMVILLVACYVMIGVRRRRFESIQSSDGHTSNIQTTI